MRSIFILVMFGMLLLLPGVSSAQGYLECVARCTAEKSSSDANCAPPGDEARALCLQDNQDAMKPCIKSCQQAARADTPTDASKDRPMETPQDTPDTPKEN
jgi:hypothetical protein